MNTPMIMITKWHFNHLDSRSQNSLLRWVLQVWECLKEALMLKEVAILIQVLEWTLVANRIWMLRNQSIRTSRCQWILELGIVTRCKLVEEGITRKSLTLINKEGKTLASLSRLSRWEEAHLLTSRWMLDRVAAILWIRHNRWKEVRNKINQWILDLADKEEHNKSLKQDLQKEIIVLTNKMLCLVVAD